MNRKHLTFLITLLLLFSCSENDPSGENENDSLVSFPYYGTYLYEDNDCGGQDIQYATIDMDGIVFFDLLSDGCDDTVECYLRNAYNIAQLSPDTLLVTSLDDNTDIFGELYLQGDTMFTLTYEANNGLVVQYEWEKIKDDIYSFDPICDREY